MNRARSPQPLVRVRYVTQLFNVITINLGVPLGDNVCMLATRVTVTQDFGVFLGRQTALPLIRHYLLFQIH